MLGHPTMGLPLIALGELACPIAQVEFSKCACPRQACRSMQLSSVRVTALSPECPPTPRAGEGDTPVASYLRVFARFASARFPDPCTPSRSTPRTIGRHAGWGMDVHCPYPPAGCPNLREGMGSVPSAPASVASSLRFPTSLTLMLNSYPRWRIRRSLPVALERG